MTYKSSVGNSITVQILALNFLHLFLHLKKLFIFGCVASSLLRVGFLQLQRGGWGGYSSLWCTGFCLQWLLLLQSTGSRCTGFSSCGSWAQ